MAVESADDLASMFDEDEFAEGASYLAPGLGVFPVVCAVIVDRGQGRQMFGGGDQKAVTSERHLWVRQTVDGVGGLVEVKRDGVFTILDIDGVPTGETLKAVGLPKLDHTGRLWSVQLTVGG